MNLFNTSQTENSFNQLSDWANDAIATANAIATQTAQTGQKVLETTTETTGKTLDAIADFPLTRFFTKTLKADWLGVALGRVNTEDVQATVTKVQRRYPHETSSEIAHRLVVNKAWSAGGVGLMTNLIPPMAIALLGVEIVAITRMQVEMVYEIAAAYGLDLNESSRRGEALAIFGLALGSNGAIKTGLSFAEVIPGIGPVLGASSNAALFYGLGYVACRYYEAKQKSPTGSVDLDAIRRASAVELADSLEQRAVMDRILIHVIRTSYPDGDWSDILPKLHTCTHLSPSSLATISETLDAPEPLDTLLDQLDPTFAVPLLAQSYRIARANGEISLAESQLLNDIAARFQLDFSAIQVAVDESPTPPQCTPAIASEGF
jgi:uncharacterized protein (DUF697 family)